MSDRGPCIARAAYAFPAESRSVRELEAAGLLQSDATTLEHFGFAQVHVATSETPYELALRAASAVLAEHGAEAESVDLLLYCGTPALAFAARGAPDDPAGSLATMDRFRYPATRLQYDLGMTRASVMALDQLACTTLLSAARLARALCLSEGLDRVLCVSAEFVPSRCGREAIYNCTSDAACAVLVEREGTRNRIVGSVQVTKGYYWECDERREEIVASYFPTARYVIAETVRQAGWSAGDVDWVIPHNVSARSWRILWGLLGFPAARLWSCNIARDGHTLAGDNFINLRDALDSGAVHQGDRLILFSYGYGAHWTALALEA
ncbi:MAG TPA: 3-oxoacyl-[acyl-carrier-protein] synthase III C-terminal domain-containing protein [Gemmatimonadaceae bacterium]